MRQYLILFFLAIFAVCAVSADYFVAQNGQLPQEPYTNSANAASNIQDALNFATNGAMVWVDAGIYSIATDAVASTVAHITNALTLRSVHGPATTIIDGGGFKRCAAIVLPNAACAFGPAVVDGFTLTNGYQNNVAAGIQIHGTAAGTGIVQNCVISGNHSLTNGGGIYAYNIVNFVPIISNCVVRGNTVNGQGGGAWFRVRGLVVDSVFHDNSAYNGGGMYFSTPWSVVDRCIISNNTASFNGGGVYVAGAGGDLRNSLIVYNSANQSGGGVYGYSAMRMYNCTVFDNSGGGVRTRTTVANGIIDNCIIDSIWVEAANTVTGYNNCLGTIPTHGAWNNTVVTTNNPDYISFVDRDAGNFRLQANSPCVNAGTNQALLEMEQMLDLDRRRRLDYMRRIPDIGCYEYVPHGSIFGIR